MKLEGKALKPSSTESAKAYIYGLAVVALATVVAWLYFFGVTFSWATLAGTIVLALTCAIAQRFPISFTRGTVEIIDVIVLASIVIFGPIWTLVVVLPSVIYKEHLRTVFVTASEIIMILGAGYIFNFLAEPLVYNSEFGSPLIYATVAAATVMYTFDAAINCTLMRLKYGVRFSENLREVFLPVIPSNFASILAALGTAYVMVAFGPAAALVLFAGAAAALISLHLIHKYQRESEELKKENAELLASSVGFAAGVVESIGAKDGYTARLAAASSVFAGDVGREFGLSEDGVEKLKVAALLQDVGMAGVPDEVFLAPPGKLNSVGKTQLERHAAEGERILSAAPGFEEAAQWVRWHHERVDGTGYPDRLKGQWIPLEARILAACGAYSSMILDTPQSAALTPQEARMELTNLAERSLDAEAVKALLRVLDREDGNYAAAADGRFAFASPARADGGDSPPSLRVV